MFSLGSVVNSRELGGYRLPGGSVVRQGLLLRGGSLAGLTDEDADILRNNYRLAKIFDFRTSTEVKAAPDRKVPGAQNIWLPAFDEESMVMRKLALPKEAYSNLGPWLLENGEKAEIQRIAKQMYLEMVSNEFTLIQYAGFMQNIISTTEGSVFWHCSQGKDRTGLAAAIVLFALGADRQLVMEDFEKSNLCYRNDLDHWLALAGSEGHRTVFRTFIGVNSEYFEEALDLVEKTWGSIQNFLAEAICLSEDDIAVLRERYLI